jgi:hypothetical protein
VYQSVACLDISLTQITSPTFAWNEQALKKAAKKEARQGETPEERAARKAKKAEKKAKKAAKGGTLMQRDADAEGS